MLTGREIDPLSAQLVKSFFAELVLGNLFDLGLIAFANHDDKEPTRNFYGGARLVYWEAGYRFLNQRREFVDFNLARGT